MKFLEGDPKNLLDTRGMFIRNLLLFFSSIFVPLTIGIPLSSGSPLYQTYFTHDTSGSVLIIEGPLGVEKFQFGFHIDAYGTQFTSDRGVVFGNAEATADPFFYAAVYGHGGYSDRFYGGNGYAWTSVNGAFRSLGWDYCSSAGNQYFCSEGLQAIGLESNGKATGTISRWFDNGDICVETKVWYIEPFMPKPVPEPAAMLLFGTGIAGLAVIGRKNRK